MIIGVCGYGFTGSGAVLDLLKGADDTAVFDKFEFSFPYSPDGLEDLELHLVKYPTRYMSSDIALKRFLALSKGKSKEVEKYFNHHFYEYSKQYVDEITQVKYRGYWMFDYFSGTFFERNFVFRIIHARVLKLLCKVKKKSYNIPPVRIMRVAVQPQNFYESTINYLVKLLDELNFSKAKNIVLDQPFPANDPTRIFHYFDCPKAIVVDRDPRDLYCLMRNVVTYDARFAPIENVEDFIKFYKITHVQKKENRSVLHIKFEDLIYDEKSTIQTIENFLEIKIDLSKSNFNPEKSIVNTNIWGKYNLQNDIKKIEKELCDYCYKFPSNKNNNNGKMF